MVPFPPSARHSDGAGCMASFGPRWELCGYSRLWYVCPFSKYLLKTKTYEYAERTFRGIETFSISDVAHAARRVIEECPKRITEKSHLGGIGLVAGSHKFYVAVNGRRRREQDAAVEGMIPSVELVPSSVGAAATKTSIPPATNVRQIRCFEPTVHEITPISIHDCQISHEMMLHEPHYVEQRVWSHFPPRPNTHPVPAHWPYGNCDIILTCRKVENIA